MPTAQSWKGGVCIHILADQSELQFATTIQGIRLGGEHDLQDNPYSCPAGCNLILISNASCESRDTILGIIIPYRNAVLR